MKKSENISKVCDINFHYGCIRDNCICKCHSPKVLKVANKSSKGQEGENAKALQKQGVNSEIQSAIRKMPSKDLLQKRKQDSSPSSFENDVSKIMKNKVMGYTIIGLKDKYCLDKTIVERDYVKRENIVKDKISLPYDEWAKKYPFFEEWLKQQGFIYEKKYDIGQSNFIEKQKVLEYIGQLQGHIISLPVNSPDDAIIQTAKINTLQLLYEFIKKELKL